MMATTVMDHVAAQQLVAILSRVYDAESPSTHQQQQEEEEEEEAEEDLETRPKEQTRNQWTPKPFQGRSRRYLWSDAFGVCNFLTLAALSSDASTKNRLLDQADALIHDVHEYLGRFRDSSMRLGDADDQHPLRGGLRIGKEKANDDGQYFHYLTKWMFALNRMSVARQDQKYNDLAIELARTAHKSFVLKSLGMHEPVRMIWKMSVDLQRVLVPSEGNLDPIDGFVTFRLLQRQCSHDPSVLQTEIDELKHLMLRKVKDFETNDELDAGEALWLTHWFPQEPWAQQVQRRALKSIDHMFASGRFEQPLSLRLLFREMGTVIGLKVVLEEANQLANSQLWMQRIDKLLKTWEHHLFDRDEDISPLMYAAAVMPGVWSRASLESTM